MSFEEGTMHKFCVESAEYVDSVWHVELMLRKIKRPKY